MSHRVRMALFGLGSLGSHLLLQVAYVAIAGGLTWARFADADVTA